VPGASVNDASAQVSKKKKTAAGVFFLAAGPVNGGIT
jgi:hypothetical protein